jgi:hypothetical protein
VGVNNDWQFATSKTEAKPLPALTCRETETTKYLRGECEFRRRELYHWHSRGLSPFGPLGMGRIRSRTRRYFTTRVSGIVDVAVPEVAVTVKV